MKRIVLKSGNIIQIKLNHNLGYIYAKVVNMCDFSEDDLSNTFHLIIYPYNYVVENEENYSEENFIKSEPFTGPLFVDDIIWAIRKGFYKIKDEIPLKDYEKRIPAFRGFSATVFKVHYYEDEATHWNYFERGTPFKRIATTYDKVKHLEGNVALDYEAVEMRLSMEIIQRSGKNIKNYYKLEDWRELSLYNNMMYKTPFNEVPDELKGKVIP
ncbi:Imm26 family immunity protein [Flavobacterium okayamense]|uniref:Immunity protein 26 n=1 Tax=Flavobacterium okayamense TaxID=2830782 RepID=A0ABN6HWF9_9FLAO|nr:Imm26 family immunity protein [Flavobacterium okayamense]BCY28636.1 hypothetical protein KK2020170_15040 [Flavobacterium okayamense]